MDRSLPNDEVLEMCGPRQINEIIGKVSGVGEIVITETKATKIGKNEGTLFCYKGKVKCGKDDLPFMEATVLAFNRSENEDAASLHARINLFSHPGIMKSFGYGFGSGEHQDYEFLALPYFESTIADYMDKSCGRTMELNRFTEEFSGLIGNVVYGLLELHYHGFCCPNLSAKHITVVKQYNYVSAKLWDFAIESGEGKGKDLDWVRLGRIIKKTAENHKSYTTEIADLCDRMRKGTLKGIDIVKHSALLSVRVKFDNILALNTFALTNCKKSSQMQVVNPKVTLHCNSPDQDNSIAMNKLCCDPSDKDKTIDSLQTLLDCDVGWKEKMPLWMKNRIAELGFRLPQLDTFRAFLWEIRCLREHENKYVPPEADIKISPWEFQFCDEQPDLESEVRRSWSYLFLVAQNFATSLQLGPDKQQSRIKENR